MNWNLFVSAVIYTAMGFFFLRGSYFVFKLSKYQKNFERVNEKIKNDEKFVISLL